MSALTVIVEIIVEKMPSCWTHVNENFFSNKRNSQALHDIALLHFSYNTYNKKMVGNIGNIGQQWSENFLEICRINFRLSINTIYNKFPWKYLDSSRFRNLFPKFSTPCCRSLLCKSGKGKGQGEEGDKYKSQQRERERERETFGHYVKLSGLIAVVYNYN